MLSRRGFLIGGAAVVAGGAGALVAVEQGWLPGRIPLARALGQCDLDVAPAVTVTAPLDEDRFESVHRGRPVLMLVAVPDGVEPDGLPVALALHGRGGDASYAFHALHLHRHLGDHVAGGGRPFALVSVDGGDGYWHPRANGDDPLTMIISEVLPRLAGRGLATEQIGVLGWSMGGYGALLLARESGRGTIGGTEVVAAAALSPALFDSFEATAAGSFDDADDFARWGDLLSDPGVDPACALSVSCGEDDPFTDSTRRYRDEVRPEPAGEIGPGCHDGEYWRSKAAGSLEFLGAHLGR